MNRLPSVLICDDDALFHLAVKQALKGICACRSAYNSDEALAIVRNQSVDLVLLDVQMRTPTEGLDAIPRLVEVDPEISIVMSSGLTDFGTVREAMRRGAMDYVPKDFDPEELKHVIRRVADHRSLLQRREQQNFEAASHQRRHVMVGESLAIRQLRRTIERMRESQANVMIHGETGTGKEVVARQLRATLPDGSLEPFVAVDSATIQGSTAESTLFGHEKGAFTGAERTTKGVFEEANGGIVYLDEIANMPLEIQAKLLRVLQEKEITRLGSARVIPLEFRVICATNRDLEAMSRAGQFKDDLLQRLNVLPIHIPPLRERREDIRLLVEHFVRQLPGGRQLEFTAEAFGALEAYPWPGNIRELCNLVAFIAAMTDGPEVDLSDLPPKFRDAAGGKIGMGTTDTAALADGRGAGEASEAARVDTASDSSEAGFYDTVSKFESRLLADQYEKLGGNVSRMALTLKMDRSHLHTKLKEYGIHRSTGGSTRPRA